jgi:hypothetical protein
MTEFETGISPSGSSPSGYVLLMSHAYDTTSSRVIGFYKGARSPSTDAYVEHLRESAQEISHPMLLPILVLSTRIGPRQEGHQRDARLALRKVEYALAGHMWSHVPVTMSLNEINAHLVACHAKVWKYPAASHKVIDKVEGILRDIICHRYYHFKAQDEVFQEINQRYLSRVAFMRERLCGIESYCHTTLSKIDMDRTALHNILLNRQNETSLQIEQRQQIEAGRKFSVNQTWNKNQRTISLLGIFFLPGAFIAVSTSL